MNKSTKFSPEVRERAVRMVQEHRGSLGAPVAALLAKIPMVQGAPESHLRSETTPDTCRNA